VKAHPLIGKAQTAENQIRSWLKDFGMNPFGKPLADMTPQPNDAFAEFETVECAGAETPSEALS
jgi:hypothetical protein